MASRDGNVQGLSKGDISAPHVTLYCTINPVLGLLDEFVHIVGLIESFLQHVVTGNDEIPLDGLLLEDADVVLLLEDADVVLNVRGRADAGR